MAIVMIQLPDEIKRIVEDRAAESGYADLSEYVRALILADVDQPITLKLEAQLVRARQTSRKSFS